jgi:DNA-binding NarL/FixJ family response regulator
MAAVTSVLLVEDQTLVRQGLRSLLSLSPGIAVAGEARDGEEALLRIAELRPDVVLLDLKMPRCDGLGLLQRLQRAAVRPPVLVLTTFDDTDLLLQAIRAGARGYLLKDVALEQLVEAIAVLAHGGTMISPALSERLLHGGALPPLPSPLGQACALTARETEILRLLAGGLSNREIAHALDLADGTVKNHVSNLLQKLGARDRTQAVLKGLELGWV